MARPRKLKMQDETTIVNQYLSGKSTVELGKKYGVDPGSVYYLLKKRGINTRNLSVAVRRYDVVEEFFDIIDTPEKAYFLGILYADGCNSTERNSVRLILTAKDSGLLKSLSNLIYRCDRPLSLRKGKWFTDKGKRYLRKDSYCLTIINQHISETLNQHGLIKAKSLKLTYPSCVHDDLLSHFTRGYFDGDGSVSFSSGQITISILGTNDFTSTLQTKLHEREIKCSVCHAKKGSLLKQLVIHGNKSGMKFLKFIYHDSSIHLKRKHEKFISISSLI